MYAFIDLNENRLCSYEDIERQLDSFLGMPRLAINFVHFGSKDIWREFNLLNPGSKMQPCDPVQLRLSEDRIVFTCCAANSSKIYVPLWVYGRTGRQAGFYTFMLERKYGKS